MTSVVEIHHCIVLKRSLGPTHPCCHTLIMYRTSFVHRQIEPGMANALQVHFCWLVFWS